MASRVLASIDTISTIIIQVPAWGDRQQKEDRKWIERLFNKVTLQYSTGTQGFGTVVQGHVNPEPCNQIEEGE
jgi:hypothetical protein